MPFTIRSSSHLPLQCLVAIAILYLVDTPVHAELCMRPVVQIDSPNQYVLSLTDALRDAKSAHEPWRLSQSPALRCLRGTSRHLDCRLCLRKELTTESAEPPHI